MGSFSDIDAVNGTDSQVTASPAVANLQSVNTASLGKLQSDDQRKLMDLVDKLRRHGLGGLLSLPQLVVCGDQSSGKSSVLEAITEIPFPRKENLCTRFATEIVLRRAATDSITTKIIPDKNRPKSDQDRLMSFTRNISHFSELPNLIDDASLAMGLGDAAEGATTRAFSRDVLSIDICGPNRPQLTIVDLPGLFHSGNKMQSKSDVGLIRGLVEEYITNERTIILAVVSAKNDYANQIILDFSQRVDPKGKRTLGIITKPDFLIEGSENQKTWIDLCLNKDIHFELGWHCLKNRSDSELNLSFQERNASEHAYFSQGLWDSNVPKDKVGIESLRTRLSNVLHNHLKKELPGLRNELISKLRETKESLARLGDKRSTLSEQKQYLMSVSMRTHDILKSAVAGHYEDDFFGPVNMEAAIDSADNVRRLRAAVQHLNLDFARKMSTWGSKYDIDSIRSLAAAETQPRTSPKQPHTDDSHHRCKKLKRAEAVEWVEKILQRSRARELPGNFNPMLISELFWEQSEPWGDIANEHIEKVADTCAFVAKKVLQATTAPEVASRLWNDRVEPALFASLASARAELDKILKDKKQHATTYNHYYTTNIQKIRDEKYGTMVSKLADASKVSVHQAAPTGHGFGQQYSTVTYIDPNKLKAKLESNIIDDMDKFSAEEALDCQMAYYKDELKYFINVVAKQVIERHLIRTLPDQVLSPLTVAGFADDEVRYIAEEEESVKQQREFLEGRKEILEKGAEVFRIALGNLRP